MEADTTKRNTGNKEWPRALSFMLLVVIGVTNFMPLVVFGQVMQSSNYQIERDSINFGGALGSSANYQLEETLGEIATGRLTSSSYILKAGYQQLDAAASTPPTPTPTPTPGGGGGIVTEEPLPEFISVSVTPDISSALMEVETEPHTKLTVRWGKTTEFETGTYNGFLFLEEHSLILTPLEPETRYLFLIEAVDGYGGEIAYSGYFTTLSSTLPGEISPLNVTNFNAEPADEGIELTWENPVHPDFDGVRIVRSDTFYPADPTDGDIIYEGLGEAALDTSAELDVKYYYSLFVRDSNGEFSSGAIDDAIRVRPGEIPPPVKGPFEDVPEALEVHPQIAELEFLDFIVIQHGRILYPTIDGHVNIDANTPFTIALDYDKVPEVLKTIGVTLTDPEDADKKFSFLLRVNREKTAYLATIDSLERAGTYHLAIAILDYENQGLRRLSGELIASTLGTGELGTFFETYITRITFGLFAFLLFLLLFCRESERKEEYYV